MYYAFFDVDETLVSFKTAINFLKFFYLKKYGLLGLLDYYLFFLCIKLYEILGVNRLFINKRYYYKYKGISKKELFTVANIWFFENKVSRSYIYPVLKELYEHKKNGANIVFVSGSFFPCLFPIAQHLGVKNIICTELEEVDEVFTGVILGGQIIGAGKKVAVESFLKNQKNGFGLQNFAYADHITDLYFLESVPNACVVAGDRKLEKIAKARKWKIINY